MIEKSFFAIYFSLNLISQAATDETLIFGFVILKLSLLVLISFFYIKGAYY